MKRGALFIAAMFAAAGLAGRASAADNMGQPTPDAINLQPAATEVMARIHAFHDILLPIIVAISAFVLALLLWVIVRYNRRANPTPRKFTHNVLVEVIWTVVPVLILVFIASLSFPLIFKEEQIPADAELTLKVTGNSWNWSYEYPDLGVSITSALLPEEDRLAYNRAHPEDARPRQLATTEPLVVPVDTTVRVLVTSSDVIHSFAVPAFGIKEDAIQGRVNDTWFRVDSSRIGNQQYFYGQCSELCGKDHAFMPIEIRVVSRDAFNQWVTAQGGTPATAANAAQPAAPAAPAATPAR